MTTSTLSLADFLLARITEDEVVAQAASPGGWSYGDVASVAGGSLYDETRMIADVHYEQPGDHDGRIVRRLLVREADANGAHIARHDPARVLAECAAKRRIVELHSGGHECPCDSGPIYRSDDPSDANWTAPCDTLRALASVYADHPEFQESWAL